jgi:23S rRNA pseudoU1915 N3-methylase RlmH
MLKAAEGAHLIACDERGKTFSSRAFADHIAMLRDRGERRLVFAIGGADGLDTRVRARPPDRRWLSDPRPGRTPWRGRCWPNSCIAP